MADDYPVVRRGIRQILSDELPGAVFGEAADAREALEQHAAAAWDVVVLDISMPGCAGLEVLKQIHRLNPHTPVVVLSMYPEPQYAARALGAGAAAYLTKGCAPVELVGAVRRALAGGKRIPAGPRKIPYWPPERDARSRHERLSDREYEVLTLIGSGKTVKEIAERLSLSVKTVSTYRARMLEKMQMKTNAELTYYAVKSGLVG